MGYPGDKYQAGLEPIDVIEVTASQAIARVMQARFAEVRLTSATLANLAVYTALTQPGDTIAVLPDWAGGHLSHHAIGVPGVRGLNVVPLPYDDEQLDVDLDALPAFLERHQPKLVVVGASLMLFPHRLSEIAGIVDVPLLYDASHVAGLIAERRFQAPLDEGADLMTFSTYKSFGGPPGGAIVTNDEQLAERVVHRRLSRAAGQLRRLAPAPARRGRRSSARRSNGAYADQCIANAQALARALDDAGLDVLGKPRGFTASHHVAIDARAHGGGPQAARTLAKGGILLSEIGIPRDPAGGVRIGTQAITRQGFTEHGHARDRRRVRQGPQRTSRPTCRRSAAGTGASIHALDATPPHGWRRAAPAARHDDQRDQHERAEDEAQPEHDRQNDHDRPRG